MGLATAPQHALVRGISHYTLDDSRDPDGGEMVRFFKAHCIFPEVLSQLLLRQDLGSDLVAKVTKRLGPDLIGMLDSGWNETGAVRTVPLAT